MKVETLLFFIFVIFAKFSQQESLGEEESELAKSLFVEESQNYIILHVEIEAYKEDDQGFVSNVPKDYYKIVNSPKYFHYGDKKLYPGQIFRPAIIAAANINVYGKKFVVIGKNNQGSLFAFTDDEGKFVAEFKQGTIIELMNDDKIDELNDFLIKNMLDRKTDIHFAEQRLKKLSKFTQYFEEEIEDMDFISKEIFKPRNQKLFTEIQQFIDKIKQYLKDFKELYSEVKKETIKFEKEKKL